MMQQAYSGEYILASRKLHTVQDICEVAFNYLDLDYRDFVLEDLSFYRPQVGMDKVGDVTKIKTLEWTPDINFESLIKMMVDRDIRLVESELSNGQ